jgi:hypothetical protein
VVVVAEDGGDLDLPADGLDVAGDGLDGGDLAALDLGGAALGDARLLGDLGLGQAEGLAALGEPVPVDAGLVAAACPAAACSPPAPARMPPRRSCRLGSSVIACPPPRVP